MIGRINHGCIILDKEPGFMLRLFGAASDRKRFHDIINMMITNVRVRHGTTRRKSIVQVRSKVGFSTDLFDRKGSLYDFDRKYVQDILLPHMICGDD